VRRALIAAGVLVMAYGVGGALLDGDVNKVGVPVFFLAVIVLHDGLFLPLMLASGALIGRIVPAGWQTTVRRAGLIGVAVTVVALPAVLGFGRDPANPSALPRSYGWGLLLILGLIWGVALGGKGFERWRRRRSR
jgi:hypothetical protein